MKKKQMILCLAVSMVILAGCTKAEESSSTVEEPRVEALDNEGESENNNDSDSSPDLNEEESENTDEEKNSPEAAKSEESGEKASENSETLPSEQDLEGSVVSIDADHRSVEVNEIITEDLGDGTSTAVALVGVGSSDNLIKIRFTEDTVYTVRTVKNSGINPEDSSNSPGSFSDIKEGSTLNMTGTYEGDEFVAASVTIYVFIR